jgi:adenylate kinase
MNIALIGPSGSGKGTHLERLKKQYDLLHLSTGDLFRENLEKKTALGLLAKKYMSQGELVPDEVVHAMVESYLREAHPEKGIVFDGFPRTVYQAKFLDELFVDMKRTLDAAVYIKVSPETILRRLSGRWICHKCQAPYHVELHPPAKQGVCDLCGGELYRRPDDNPDFVAVRLRAFQRVTSPLLEFYQSTNRLAIIDGQAAVDVVYGNISRVLEPVSRKEGLSVGAAAAAQLRTLKPVRVAPGRREGLTGLGFVLVGGPGSGKGTQAEQLSKHLHLQHIASGDLFRDNLKRQTELGKLAKTYMDRGELVPDDVTEAMVQERLSRPDTEAGFLLDGFPRTLPQAESLTEMLEQLGRRLAGVLYINVSDEEIVNRLSGRLICRECQTPYHKQFKPPAKPGVCDNCGGELYQRDDDNPQTVRARLKTFHGQTAPLIQYYQKERLVAEILGEGDVAKVTERTLAAAQLLAV